NAVNFRKNVSTADLNLTLQGYEFDHPSTFWALLTSE
ncbi:hypothetical protein X777_04725, partial [Ooceraea biroi]